jgi:hypothetical protein
LKSQIFITVEFNSTEKNTHSIHCLKGRTIYSFKKTSHQYLYYCPPKIDDILLQNLSFYDGDGNIALQAGDVSFF